MEYIAYVKTKYGMPLRVTIAEAASTENSLGANLQHALRRVLFVMSGESRALFRIILITADSEPTDYLA